MSSHVTSIEMILFKQRLPRPAMEFKSALGGPAIYAYASGAQNACRKSKRSDINAKANSGRARGVFNICRAGHTLPPCGSADGVVSKHRRARSVAVFMPVRRDNAIALVVPPGCKSPSSRTRWKCPHRHQPRLAVAPR